jgi:uncharacterized protein
MILSVSQTRFLERLEVFMMRFRSAARFGIATAIVALSAAAQLRSGHAEQSGPSFDCAKASLPDEKVICADPMLAAMDRLIAEGYADYLPGYDTDKKTLARALNADRHRCESDRACVAAVLVNALQTFSTLPPWADQYMQGLIGKKALDTAAGQPRDVEQPMPEKVGDCTLTHVAELMTRIGNPLDGADADEGSQVLLANDGLLVSYEREFGLTASQVGDPVAICLMSIPRDCPTGDDRGRMYYGVNIARQGATWALSDSIHLCGGA